MNTQLYKNTPQHDVVLSKLQEKTMDRFMFRQRNLTCKAMQRLSKQIELFFTRQTKQR